MVMALKTDTWAKEIKQSPKMNLIHIPTGF